MEWIILVAVSVAAIIAAYFLGRQHGYAEGYAKGRENGQTEEMIRHIQAIPRPTQRRFEMSPKDLVDIPSGLSPIMVARERLEAAGFRMDKEIVWWEDHLTGNRVFTQEIEK